ncbi:MAG: helix-turn-helix transcriptional regulator [Clostridia bacterium]|nr:helix-turn-helix transcriptional regulator [Clostridia bacterium]
MFYETHNLLISNSIKLEHGVDFSFPPHLHGSFELITVTEGELTVRIDADSYTLTPGYALLIFPNQVHELVTPKHSCHYLCIFSPNLIQAYSRGCLSLIPENSLFRIDDFYIRQLISLTDSSSLAHIKGLLYSICADFDNTARYRNRGDEQSGLLLRIFRFVEKNYDSDCSLSALSAELGYNYVYLSKYFKQRTAISFTDYVNRYRINEACYLIGNTEKTLLNVAFDCGFDSLRSFNRNFVRIVGTPPSEYRRNRFPSAEPRE